MTTIAAFIILAASAITAFISGIFGMAGGIILMAILISLSSVTVAMAMIIHGTIQMVANGWRAYLLREHIDWLSFRRYALGAIFGIAALSLIFLGSWRPDKQLVYFVLGLTPMLVWLPKERFHLDFTKRNHAIFAGFGVQGLNTIAGVAGPLLDLFFIRNSYTRQQIVATKSVTQCLSHIVKVGFWTVPIISASGWGALPPPWFFAAAIPIAMSGTWVGKQVLTRMEDVNFKRYVKWIVTVIGGVLLLRAFGVY